MPVLGLIFVMLSLCFLLPFNAVSMGGTLQPPLPTIETFDIVRIPKDEFDLSKNLQSFDQEPYQTLNNRAVGLTEKHHYHIMRIKVPVLKYPTIIRLYYASHPNVRVYTLKDGKVEEVAHQGDRYVAVELGPNESHQYLYFVDLNPLALTSSAPLIFETSRTKDFAESSRRDFLFIGIIAGIIAIMSLYNLGMFLLFRKVYLLHYLIYSLSYLYIFLFSSGFFSRSSSVLFFHYLAAGSVCTFMLQFSMTVLNLNSAKDPLYVLARLVQASVIVVFLAILLGSETAARSYLLPGPPAFLLSFFMAARSAYRGFKPAYSMMVGWSGLFIADVLLILQYTIEDFPNMGWALPIGLAFEIATFSFAISQKLRLSELAVMRENAHAFGEMQKMVYPHQLEQIRKGLALESTMPTHPAKACVLSFDIARSSEIRHMQAKEFFRQVFARCNELMYQGYNGEKLQARAYRIKEMGDGFLCSIGYPFQSVAANPAADAVLLAEEFIAVLHSEAEHLHSLEPITCGVGIAIDLLNGFYPASGTKEYDLYGPALVLATRYESMRKSLLPGLRDASAIIIQEDVYVTLPPDMRKAFTMVDLQERGLSVRDDAAATRVYYKTIKAWPTPAVA